jgi:acylphosphatase
MPERVARQLVVRGHVQGVFFRSHVRQAAARHRVAGWAQNMRDGTVAVRLEGEPAAVDEVERICRRGPRGARVDDVEVGEVAVEDLEGFDVR